MPHRARVRRALVLLGPALAAGTAAAQGDLVLGVLPNTDLGVGRMLLSGEAAAAILSGGELRALPPEEAARLKVVEVFARIPNFIVLGHPRLGDERLARLKAQLLAFGADRLDGAAFARATGVSAIVDVDAATLRELDPYTAATRRALGVGP
jgi:ABC-type phosphate/phosphonate transport system substrate-binding protein